jgi:hypothetical protein
MARRKKAGEERGNGFDPDQLAEFVGRIEDLQGQIDMINLEARSRAQPFRDDIAQVKRKANDAGINRTEFAAVLRQRRLEQKAANVPDSLDLAQRANFQQMIECLDRLAEQVGPLGEAARDHARAGA